MKCVFFKSDDHYLISSLPARHTLRSTSNMASLIPLSLATWNWDLNAAKSVTSYLEGPAKNVRFVYAVAQWANNNVEKISSLDATCEPPIACDAAQHEVAAVGH